MKEFIQKERKLETLIESIVLGVFSFVLFQDVTTVKVVSTAGTVANEFQPGGTYIVAMILAIVAVVMFVVYLMGDKVKYVGKKYVEKRKTFQPKDEYTWEEQL